MPFSLLDFVLSRTSFCRRVNLSRVCDAYVCVCVLNSKYILSPQWERARSILHSTYPASINYFWAGRLGGAYACIPYKRDAHPCQSHAMPCNLCLSVYLFLHCGRPKKRPEVRKQTRRGPRSHPVSFSQNRPPGSALIQVSTSARPVLGRRLLCVGR
ncbi:hypothetical protein CKAH01_01473 [Colletotrichum kahawae]|uniref:Uncharacterized protein n=1 Tax=Colletotrichum kahawae TaxID=34407 RepID=A0AAD9Y7R0_COLKA|nr:hypothetical protein CKAH01_01473 [Colletotrichum kahawae]